jgi:hypothetical protein
MVTFQLNLDRLLELVARVDGAIEEYNTKELVKARERLSSARLRDDVYELGRVLGAHLRSSSAFTLQLQWYAVMLVTFAETYLQDVLADSAKFDPALMADSKQSALYEQVVAAGSIEDLATTMRDRWSRNFVNSGGPTYLIDRLKRMGANFREGLVDDLEELWGVRHAIVHNAGRRTSELARRHPDVTYDQSKQIIVNSEQFKNYALAVIDFTNTIDSFLLGRVGSDLRDK